MHRIFTIIVIVLLFTSGIVFFAEFAVQVIAAESFSGGAYGSRLKMYSNLDTGVTVRYPDAFSVDSAYVYDGLGKQKRIAGVAFTIPKSVLEGTNLSADTKVSVEVIPNVPRCSARMFIRDLKKIKPLLDGENSYSFGYTKEQTAGHIYEEDIFAIPESSPCVAVRYFIHSKDIGGYVAGSVKEFDRNDLLTAFDVVRSSLSMVTK